MQIEWLLASGDKEGCYLHMLAAGCKILVNIIRLYCHVSQPPAKVTHLSSTPT